MVVPSTDHDLQAIDRPFTHPLACRSKTAACLASAPGHEYATRKVNHPPPSSGPMSFASALSILRPTLPSYLALTKYDLLHIEQDCFEYRPNAAAPPLAVEMARAVFAMGASSCIESFVL